MQEELPLRTLPKENKSRKKEVHGINWSAAQNSRCPKPVKEIISIGTIV